jgi:hypothetical protein
MDSGSLMTLKPPTKALPDLVVRQLNLGPRDFDAGTRSGFLLRLG